MSFRSIRPVLDPRKDRLPGPFWRLGLLCRSLKNAWSAPRPAHTVVVVLAMWLTLVANLTLWRTLAGIDPGPRGVINSFALGVITAAMTSALPSPTAWNRDIWRDCDATGGTRP